MSDDYTSNGCAPLPRPGDSDRSQSQLCQTSNDPITREGIARHLSQPSGSSKSPGPGELLAGQENYLGLPAWILPYEDDLRRWEQRTTELLKSGLRCPLSIQSVWVVPASVPDHPNHSARPVLLACDAKLEVVDGMRLTCIDPQEGRVRGTVAVLGATVMLSRSQAMALVPGAWVEGAASVGRISKPPHLESWLD